MKSLTGQEILVLLLMAVAVGALGPMVVKLVIMAIFQPFLLAEGWM